MRLFWAINNPGVHLLTVQITRHNASYTVTQKQFIFELDTAEAETWAYRIHITKSTSTCFSSGGTAFFQSIFGLVYMGSFQLKYLGILCNSAAEYKLHKLQAEDCFKMMYLLLVCVFQGW